MSKLVRARLKRVEHLPEWAKCCDAFVEAMHAEGVMVIDLAKIEVGHPGGCEFCDAPRPGQIRGAPDVADDQLVPLDIVDLDEGPADKYVDSLERV